MSRRRVALVGGIALQVMLQAGALLGPKPARAEHEASPAQAPWQKDLLQSASAGRRGSARLLLTREQIAVALQTETPPAPPADLETEAARAPHRWWPIAASAVLPGLGEAITGHKRGYAFIAVDAASWFAVKHYSDKGKNIEDDYKQFADAHWSEFWWESALNSGELHNYFGGVYGQGTTKEQVPLYVSKEKDAREWYENLGKWDVFYWGWDDGYYRFGGAPLDTANPDFSTPNRTTYVNMRGDSNHAFSNRDKFLTLNVITRVLSVLDVAYLEGFIGGHYKNKAPSEATGGSAGAALATGAGSGGPQVSLVLDPRGLTETRLGVRLTY
jgi:hypothetical protein